MRLPSGRWREVFSDTFLDVDEQPISYDFTDKDVRVLVTEADSV